MIVLPKSYERRSLLPVETALALMISFGSLIATIIFGILAVVNNDKKKK
ncbi:putative holin-like toxin [Enterococcus thailandicus]|nr:putative holin-like toxin [Enterococcus thailandicus]GMC02510.1 putative holin-like toxin [Enterococcus thailandicus]GMC10036.1 putative holin-like toxin [Enterococcus thailandicus]